MIERNLKTKNPLRMKTIFNFLLFIIFFMFLMYTCDGGKRKSPLHVYIKEDSIMKSMIGKRIRYEKDSITVVDYSFWQETYTLSNGTKVNKKLIR